MTRIVWVDRNGGERVVSNVPDLPAASMGRKFGGRLIADLPDRHT